MGILALCRCIDVVAQEFPSEKLDRGLVAVKTPSGVFLSWRCLISDPDNISFDIYRDNVKVNDSPVIVTNYLDSLGSDNVVYKLKVVTDDTTTYMVNPWPSNFLRIHLNRPQGGKTPPFRAINRGRVYDRPDGEKYRYIPGDCSVGDVDGDGQYEIIVKWDPTNARDNSFRGFTGEVYLDCYRFDGSQLWRINLGKNIRAGAHYTQFLVYDFDGDGKSELVCKTAPGTIDGKGNYVLLPGDNPDADYREYVGDEITGTIMSGPEYLTVFSGETGHAITTIPYPAPRDITHNWGDNKANRSERYLACVAYLDGKRPSLVICRGYYTKAYVAAYDFDGTKLTKKWFHRSETPGKGLYGEGAHSISVADVDADCCDEIIFGSAVLDNDGTILHRTGLGHGDALHVADIIPARDGLEIFMVYEESKGAALRDARTGEILRWFEADFDNGRGVAADIDSLYQGHELWSLASNKVYSSDGFKRISRKRPPLNFRIYWDGDLCDELLDGTSVYKWNSKEKESYVMADFKALQTVSSCNSSKKTPSLSADIIGDWREEVILWDKETASDLVLFTTTIPSSYSIPTLMQDRTYRLSIIWQNVAYNQPPHLGCSIWTIFPK